MCGCSKGRGTNNIQRSRLNLQSAPIRANIAPTARIAPIVAPLSLTGSPQLPHGVRGNDLRRIQRLQQQAIRRNQGKNVI